MSYMKCLCQILTSKGIVKKNFFKNELCPKRLSLAISICKEGDSTPPNPTRSVVTWVWGVSVSAGSARTVLVAVAGAREGLWHLESW